MAGFSLQVRWTCSGVPSLAARDRRARVAAFAGLTVAAQQASAAGAGQYLAARHRRMRDRGGRSEFSGTMES